MLLIFCSTLTVHTCKHTWTKQQDWQHQPDYIYAQTCVLHSLLGLYLQQILLLDEQVFISVIRQPACVVPTRHLNAWSAEETDALLKGEY